MDMPKFELVSEFLAEINWVSQVSLWRLKIRMRNFNVIFCISHFSDAIVNCKLGIKTKKN